MEKSKISPYQLFALILLFELGNALLVPIGAETNQDAWLAILIGMVVGFGFFFIYHKLYSYYPDSLPTTYIPQLIGKVLGTSLALLYIVYFLHLSARVLRYFGEMLAVIAYPDTPLFINHILFILVVIYTVNKGIEVIARTGELAFFFVYFIAVFGFVLIIVSGVIDIQNLRPVLEEGIKPVLKVAFADTLFFPFGEMIVFMMILPYLNDTKKARLTGLVALGLSGVNLAITMAINIGVLGAELVSRTPFALLSTIQEVRVAEFLERLDIFFMVTMVIFGFFKVCIFFYAAVIGTADLFKIKQPSQLAFPLGLVVLFVSMTTASSITEHLYEGTKVFPLFVHLPFQVIIPLGLLMIAFFKNRKKSKKGTSAS